MAATEITLTATKNWERPIAYTYGGEGSNTLTGGGAANEVFYFLAAGFNGFSLETHPSADGTLEVLAVNDTGTITPSGDGVVANNGAVQIGDDIAVTAADGDIRNFTGRYRYILVRYAKTAETAGTITCKVHAS